MRKERNKEDEEQDDEKQEWEEVEKKWEEIRSGGGGGGGGVRESIDAHREMVIVVSRQLISHTKTILGQHLSHTYTGIRRVYYASIIHNHTYYAYTVHTFIYACIHK